MPCISVSVIVLVCVLLPHVLFAQDKILIVDLRHRPPEMIVDGEKYSGPLLDIISHVLNLSLQSKRIAIDE